MKRELVVATRNKGKFAEIVVVPKDVPDEKRGAQFHAVIALYSPATKKIKTCEGICRGIIAREPHGNGGFGYDPVFYHEGLGKTVAEMSLEEKNKVSHRGIALLKARKVLMKEYLG